MMLTSSLFPTQQQQQQQQSATADQQPLQVHICNANKHFLKYRISENDADPQMLASTSFEWTQAPNTKFTLLKYSTTNKQPLNSITAPESGIHVLIRFNTAYQPLQQSTRYIGTNQDGVLRSILTPNSFCIWNMQAFEGGFFSLTHPTKKVLVSSPKSIDLAPAEGAGWEKMFLMEPVAGDQKQQAFMNKGPLSSSVSSNTLVASSAPSSRPASTASNPGMHNPNMRSSQPLPQQQPQNFNNSVRPTPFNGNNQSPLSQQPGRPPSMGPPAFQDANPMSPRNSYQPSPNGPPGSYNGGPPQQGNPGVRPPQAPPAGPTAMLSTAISFTDIKSRFVQRSNNGKPGSFIMGKLNMQTHPHQALYLNLHKCKPSDAGIKGLKTEHAESGGPVDLNAAHQTQVLIQCADTLQYLGMNTLDTKHASMTEYEHAVAPTCVWEFQKLPHNPLAFQVLITHPATKDVYVLSQDKDKLVLVPRNQASGAGGFLLYMPSSLSQAVQQQAAAGQVRPWIQRAMPYIQAAGAVGGIATASALVGNIMISQSAASGAAAVSAVPLASNAAQMQQDAPVVASDTSAADFARIDEHLADLTGNAADGFDLAANHTDETVEAMRSEFAETLDLSEDAVGLDEFGVGDDDHFDMAHGGADMGGE